MRGGSSTQSPSKGKQSPSRPAAAAAAARSRDGTTLTMEDGAVRVMLRDSTQGAKDVLLVAPEVMSELRLLPGDHAQCAASEGNTAHVKLWPHEDVAVATAECGALLLAQLGVSLGQRVWLRAPFAPLLTCEQLTVESGDGSAGDLTHLAWGWRGVAVWPGAVLVTSRGGRAVPLRVVSCTPSPALVQSSTRVARHTDTALARASAPHQPHVELVGMDTTVARLLRCLDWAATSSASATADGPRGTLLVGPVGCGKSAALDFALAQRPAIRAMRVGDTSTAAAIAQSFREASLQRASVVVVDHLERLTASGALAAALSATSTPVIALCSGRVDAVPALVRHHFEAVVEIGPLEASQRLAMLSVLVGADAVPRDLQLPGMVAGDVAAVAREAQLLAALRAGDGAPVSADDVRQAVRRVHQHSAREWEIDVPRVSLDAIGGMVDVKRRLVELLDWPLRYGDALQRLGVRPASGVLMYGPPGNGKTMMARAVATRCQAAFIAVKGPELYSKYVGESERALEAVFVQARRSVPCVVFLDEIDALAPRRGVSSGGQVGDRVLSTLLSQLDGVTPLSGVTVLAATNRPDQLDAALLRPGRLSHHLYVPLPDAEARLSILASLLRGVPLDADLRAGLDDSLRDLAQRCEGRSGAECSAVVREAKLQALERDGEPLLTRADLEWALTQCPPRTAPESLAFYESWRPA